MILIDTNIIIDYWKKPDSNMETVFDNELCAVCGVVRTELLRGAVSEKNVHEIINAISEFEYIDFAAEDWDELGNLSTI